jgi:hypothetical protein
MVPVGLEPTTVKECIHAHKLETLTIELQDLCN